MSITFEAPDEALRSSACRRVRYEQGSTMASRREGMTSLDPSNLLMVTAQVMLTAGSAHLSVSVREGPAAGTWRYKPRDGTDVRAQ